MQVTHAIFGAGIFIAKGCGMMLNFNCALIAVPVTTTIMHKLHSIKIQGDTVSTDQYGYQVGAEAKQRKSLDKYVALGKNITLHRYIAYTIALTVAVHTVAHFVNCEYSIAGTARTC